MRTPNCLLLALALILSMGVQAQKPTKASGRAIVKAGQDVRFTVLTDGVIRMEWDSTGVFTNDPSFVVVNRDLPVPKFKTQNDGNWLTISTKKMSLRYKLNSGKFSEENLVITSDKSMDTQIDSSFHSFEWIPGMQQKENLKGTYRTLDGYEGDKNWNGQTIPIEDGLLAKDGWNLIDDSKSFLFDDSKWSWVKIRTNLKAQDLYFFAYGRDYKAVLQDFSRIAGKVPMPPKYAFGYWWSRYWSYSDKEIRELVTKFDEFNVPLDVLVVDMDWHITKMPGWGWNDEFGEYSGWTGWTWNKGLFPDPNKFLDWTASKNLKITLNLHPASGVLAHESQYKAVAEKMGVDTATHKGIPWEGSNKLFVQTMFDEVLHPMEKDGVDFWWLDWQQFANDKKVEGLNNTWWCNYLFFSDMERTGKHRPMLYHRWGGLGNHRYQIGFSGDSYVSWKSLEFQPYFTNCASNVLYGYWSHDIGGHQLAKSDTTLDPELYTRWMQYGVFSPILRTHSSKNAILKKEIWNFRADFFDAQKEAIRLRYNLVPYIYTMSRECNETGVSICRPMYYDYPNAQEAYDFSREYMFGDDVLIAPIGAPMQNGATNVKVWLPEGNDWFEWHTGTLLKGGQTTERSFTIQEYPIYIKAGAIIPMYDDSLMDLQSEPKVVRVAVFPGADGKSQMYEDNGDSKDYEKSFAYTYFNTNYSDNKSLEIKISKRDGKYEGMPLNRRFQLYLYGQSMPVSVTLNGKKIPFSYMGDKLCVTINLLDMVCSDAKKIVVKFKSDSPELNDGLLKQFHEITKACTALKYKDAGVILPPVVGDAEETSLKLEYFPDRFNELIENFRKTYPEVQDYLKNR